MTVMLQIHQDTGVKQLITTRYENDSHAPEGTFWKWRRKHRNFGMLILVAKPDVKCIHTRDCQVKFCIEMHWMVTEAVPPRLHGSLSHRVPADRQAVWML